MQHYQPFNQPWYIENNPLRNGLHGGGSNGLESAVNDVYVNNGGNNGPFDYIGRAGNIFSAIPDSVKRIAAVSGLAALLGLLYLESACSSPGPIQNPSVPSTSTPAISQRTQTDRLTELTTQEFITNAQAGKYKRGDWIVVSGVVKKVSSYPPVGITPVYLNPPYNVYIVVAEFPNKGENAKHPEDFRAGQEIVVRGEFDRIVDGTFSYVEVTLINSTLIEKAP